MSHTGKSIMCATLFIVALSLAACGPKAPDQSLILWEQPLPSVAAMNHAIEKGYFAYQVNPTGSMEPYMTGGDWIVVAPKHVEVYEKLKASDLCVYAPAAPNVQYYPGLAESGTDMLCHMAAAKSGDEWIMDGIANSHYERGILRMNKSTYRGKVVQIYTKRKKP